MSITPALDPSARAAIVYHDAQGHRRLHQIPETLLHQLAPDNQIAAARAANPRITKNELVGFMLDQQMDASGSRSPQAQLLELQRNLVHAGGVKASRAYADCARELVGKTEYKVAAILAPTPPINAEALQNLRSPSAHDHLEAARAYRDGRSNGR